jgi:hypothetical protein
MPRMPRPEVLEKIVLDNLRTNSGLSVGEFPKSLSALVERGRKEWQRSRKVLRQIFFKESTEEKLRILSHQVRCSQTELIRIILDFELLSRKELKKKYLAP